MLSAPSQVLLRNKEYFAQGRWLIANPTDSDIFNQLGNPQLWGFHQYFDIYQQCMQQANQFSHQFSHIAQQSDGAYDGAILYMPKAKEQARMLIANLASLIKPGGLLFLVGENKSGIKGADKLFSGVSTLVNKLDSARHCALYCATVEQQDRPFNLQDWISKLTIDVADTRLSIVTLPGVFSSNELDAGTRLLLENLPTANVKNVLDFACGNGVIGCVIASKYPQANITLSDVSALAVYCAQRNIESLTSHFKVVPSDGLNDIAGQFDQVLTNPPFHTGLKTDYSITDDFIRQIKAKLSKNGRLTLVANRFLPYPDMLEQHVGKCRTLAQTSKFNLYQCG